MIFTRGIKMFRGPAGLGMGAGMAPVMAAFMAVVLVVAPGAARAQDKAAVDKVTQLNKKAIDAYENLDFEEARKLLKQALDMCSASGMDQHPMKARTHIHMGIIFVGGFKQKDAAIKQFRKALEINPDIQLTPRLVNPDVQAVFDEAKAGGGAAAAAAEPGPPAPPPAPPPPPKPRDTPPDDIQGLYHDPVTDGYKNQGVVVKCAVGTDIEFDKIVLAYRPKDASEFLARTMEKDDKGWWKAEIPSAATNADVVEYYIEVRNKVGQAVAANGSARTPNLVTLGNAPPPKVVKHKRKQAADEEGGEEGGAEPVADEGEKPRGRKHRKAAEEEEEAEDHTFFFAFGLGAGAGWTQGHPEVNPKDSDGNDVLIQPGIALAPMMHFMPEVGIFLAPDFTLSLQARLQWVSGTTTTYGTDCGSGNKATGVVDKCPPATGAASAFLKATWLFGEGKFHPFFNVNVGGGIIRHVVNLAPASIPGCGVVPDETGKLPPSSPGDPVPACKDTVRSGAFLAGPGVGFWYELTPSVVFNVGLQSQVGVPNFTVNADLNLGLAILM